MQTFFKSDLPSRVGAKRQKKADAEQEWRSVVRAVNERDGCQCRACSRRCDPNAPDMLRKGHHHHLIYRSAGGGNDSANILVLCSTCHADEHAHRLQITTDSPAGADGPISVYRRAEDGTWFQSRREIAIHRVEKD